MSTTRAEIIRQTVLLILDNPSSYLAEKSLKNFQAYGLGFTCRAEPMWRRLFFPEGFDGFIDTKYCNFTTHGALNVITLYSKNSAEAWDRYFDLVGELKKVAHSDEPSAKVPREESIEISLSDLLPALIARPAMYVGNSSFKLVAEFITGCLAATATLGYEESEYEHRFRLLLRYIEEFDINLPGLPWHAIVWYHSMNDTDALKLFSDYFDEFVGQKKGWVRRIEYHLNRRLKARRKFVKN